MSHDEIESSARSLPSFNAALCSLLAAYTVVSILDHDRWMKEWGNDHEAVAVMHLRFPTLSAAVAMGFGAIATVHHVGLQSLDLEGIEIEYDVLLTLLGYVVAISSFFAAVLVAQRDLFAGLDRMERLKMCILERHTIADLRRSKHIGKKMAFFGRPTHVALAGVMLASGMLGSWAINVLAMTGDFYVVWLPWPLALLALATLASSILCCWLLFRILVWKPSDVPLRSLCSIFVALCTWSMDFFGNIGAVRFERLLGSKPKRLTYSFSVEDDGAEWELILLVFGSVMTQYAIALELRLAYCGLQDANFDLQLLAGTIGLEDHSRRSSAMSDHACATHHRGQALKSLAESTCRVDAQSPSPKQNGRGLTNTSPHTPPNRRRRPSLSGSQSPAGTPANTRTSPRPSIVTIANAGKRVNLARPSAIAASLTRMSSTLGVGPPAVSRSVRVQPVDVGKVYTASSPTPSFGSNRCAEGGGRRGTEPPSMIAVRQLEELEEGDRARRASEAASGRSAMTGKDGETVHVGPPRQKELPARVI